MKKTSSYTGRANTVLTFGRGDNVIAVITTIVAHARNEKNGERIQFVGPAIFEKKTTKHIQEVVLALADGILRDLNLPPKCFDISVVNLDAASIMEVGLNISGFSADVPILLAILSDILQMRVPEDLVSTGHLASPDGDIRMVKNIPAKLEAALKAGSITRFIHPAIPEEDPLDSFSRRERENASDALTRAKREIRTTAVRDVGNLLQEVFSDEQAILSSLRNGFYRVPAPQTGNGAAVQFLAQNEKGFWTVLERQLLQGRNNDAKDVLLAYARYYIGEKTYPKGLGGRLLRLIQSLPPATLRNKLDFPLTPTSECIQLVEFAKDSETNLEDVPFLFLANTGEKMKQHATNQEQIILPQATDLDHDKTLQAFLPKISSQTLTKLINRPIDNARATYTMDSVTVKSTEEFNETITSFYLHLIRHTSKVCEPVDSERVAADALQLLRQAFLKRGGYRAALAEAINGLQGGLRLIFDLMTEQYKREEQEKYIFGVFKTVFEPLEEKDKVGLMRALMKRLESHLGPEILSQPPEWFVLHFEPITRSYVQSMDQMGSIFRSL